MEKRIEESEEVATVAASVIKKEELDFGPARIKYVKVYPNITKTTVGRCTRANYKLAHFADCDYLIEMSGEIWDILDEETRYILTLHELNHVYPVFSEKKGEWSFKILDHDVQDFKFIIERYGVDWFFNMKTIVSSTYDLDPKQEATVRA